MDYERISEIAAESARKTREKNPKSNSFGIILEMIYEAISAVFLEAHIEITKGEKNDAKPH